MSADETPERRVERAGERVREALEAYRSAYSSAARAASDRDVHDRLRDDWEACVAAFRDTVDRIGALQKTLTRDG